MIADWVSWQALAHLSIRLDLENLLWSRAATDFVNRDGLGFSFTRCSGQFVDLFFPPFVGRQLIRQVPVLVRLQGSPIMSGRASPAELCTKGAQIKPF